MSRFPEGESLVNDATAPVAYQLAVAAVVTGSFSLAHASVRFVFVSVGGVVVGLATGWLAGAVLTVGWMIPSIEITVSLLTPFVAYSWRKRGAPRASWRWWLRSALAGSWSSCSISRRGL
ncbi:MAG: cation:proton antiporter [Verrucomicrobiota bacterium]